MSTKDDHGAAVPSPASQWRGHVECGTREKTLQGVDDQRILRRGGLVWVGPAQRISTMQSRGPTIMTLATADRRDHG